jgi:hypothetical protein
MTTRAVTGTILRPDGTPWANAHVWIELVGGTYTLSPDDTYPANEFAVTADAAGQIAVTLASGLAIVYAVRLPDGTSFTIERARGCANDA